MLGTLDKIIKTRNEISGIIDTLVNEALVDFDTYDEAIQAINKLKWDMPGFLGKCIIEEATKRIKRIALEKATKNSDL